MTHETLDEILNPLGKLSEKFPQVCTTVICKREEITNSIGLEGYVTILETAAKVGSHLDRGTTFASDIINFGPAIYLILGKKYFRSKNFNLHATNDLGTQFKELLEQGYEEETIRICYRYSPVSKESYGHISERTDSRKPALCELAAIKNKELGTSIIDKLEQTNWNNNEKRYFLKAAVDCSKDYTPEQILDLVDYFDKLPGPKKYRVAFLSGLKSGLRSLKKNN